MSGQVVADTHALIWYLFDTSKLSTAGRAALDGSLEAGLPVLVSAISIVEIVYLEERHRISTGVAERIRQACAREEPSLEIVPVDARLAFALRQISRADVPDMPDRIIAATAAFLRLPLVTRDEKIRASGLHTICA